MLEPLTVLGVAVALGADAFSLALGLGLAGVGNRTGLSLIAAVGLLHVALPVAGLQIGLLVGRLAGKLAAYLGALVLAGIGASMLWEAWREGEGRPGGLPLILSAVGQGGVARGFTAVAILASSVSLDALSVGVGLGALKVNLLATVLILGSVAALMTTAGLLFGERAGGWLGRWATATGGLILLAIGFKLLLGW